MAQQIIVVPFSGQLIGQGYNSETGENVGTALTVDSVFEDSSTDAQQAATDFELAETQDSLMESLGVSASADVRVGLFSGGAKMSFAESHAVNSSSTYVAGRSFVQNAIRHGQGFKLTDAAKAMLAANDLAGFKTAFGDMFVRSLYTGGEFCVIARITSISDDHQSQLAISLHGEYNGFLGSGSFQAALNSANSETHNQTDVTVKMYQFGGQDAELSFTGPDAASIRERLDNLPQYVHDHAGGLEAELATYDTIPIPIPNPEDREDRLLVLKDCADQKTGFLKSISDLEQALEPDANLLFDNLPSNDILADMEGKYRDAMSDLLSHAIRVSTGLIDPPTMFVANPAPPPFHFSKKPFVPLTPDFVNVPSGDERSGPGLLRDANPLAQSLGITLDITTLNPQEPWDNGTTVISQIPIAGQPLPLTRHVAVAVET